MKTTKKILVIGSNGMLGTDFVSCAKGAGHDVIAVDYPDIDIRDESSTMSVVDNAAPNIIVNCAAYTAVDKCETDVEAAFAVNGYACKNLVAAAKKNKSLLIHISTDYVFDGEGKNPYTENDAANPKSIYGKSKFEGEQIILNEYADNSMIFRIAWLYGAHGKNFVGTILKLAENATADKPLKVVNDQTGSPTWTVNVCEQILLAIEKFYDDKKLRGIIHATSEGFCTWFDFAKMILGCANINKEIMPCTTNEFPRPAPRPKYGVLDNVKLKSYNINIMPKWDDALREYFKSIA